MMLPHSELAIQRSEVILLTRSKIWADVLNKENYIFWENQEKSFNFCANYFKNKIVFTGIQKEKPMDYYSFQTQVMDW